jgi:hypothetical protein
VARWIFGDERPSSSLMSYEVVDASACHDASAVKREAGAEPLARRMEPSSWEKRSNKCGRNSGPMPMPVSETTIWI